eukprot:COSAG02_NODE_6004_length_3881_cov_46.869117_5_plen_147_part_00
MQLTKQTMNAPQAVRFAPSTRRSKKLMAEFFLNDGSTRRVHFGAAGAPDYTTHRDPERKRRYLLRHAPRERWDLPMTPGALSRWVLWNRPTLSASIADYTRRFRIGRADDAPARPRARRPVAARQPIGRRRATSAKIDCTQVNTLN